MGVRESSCAGTWVREFLLEVTIPEHTVVDGTEDIDKTFLELFCITDCKSLRDVIVKSSLPEDARAAIEVLSIREMMDETMEDELDAGSQENHLTRLKESRLDHKFRWCCSSQMKADRLTKTGTRGDRRQWLDSKHVLELTPMVVPNTEGITSKKRTKVSVPALRKILSECEEGRQALRDA